ncbi:MAG: HlyD family efflux transporter periplasmic adaptor subunit [Rhodospirillales bacterium]|nr:MAG: HlyD family efflux transporter periplasmic adaptor subunit [Rhodospirillales bacterium]
MNGPALMSGPAARQMFGARMRFLFRGIAGIVLLAVTIGLIGIGVWRLVAAGDAGDSRRRGAEERSFVVHAATLERTTVRPKIVAYGEIRSWRSLELRAAAGGRLVDIAPDFRDGAAVKAGDLLFLIDPAEAAARLADAGAALADAEAEKAEADEAVGVAELEHAAALRQRDLRRQALQRQRQLLGKGFATDASVEEAELALASAEQSVLRLAQARIVARKRVERSAFAVTRAAIAVDDASRSVEETRVEAPFPGLLSEVDAVLGRRVTANEKLGILIDPSALEAVFRLSNAQFARLIDADGTLRPTRVTVALELGDLAVSVPGSVDRAAAVVGEGQSGRLVYAKLETGPTTILRPGDFITVTIEEAELSDVAILPASAVTADGRLLLIDAESRITETTVTILRRQGDSLIVADAPSGARYVTHRTPQLGPGILVRPAAPDGSAAPEIAVENDDERMAISEMRRQALIAFVRDDPSLPQDRKARLLQLLSQPEVPKRLIERLEARMAGQG